MQPGLLRQLLDSAIFAAVLLKRSFGQVFAVIAYTPTILVWHGTAAKAWWKPSFRPPGPIDVDARAWKMQIAMFLT